MAIKQQWKKSKKKTTLMTDPKPVFVSLVNHGANQTPFKVVKFQQVENEQEGSTVADLVKKGEAELVQVRFNKETFASEAAAKTWLVAEGFDVSGAEFVEEDGFLVMKSGDAEGAQEIPVNTDVVYFLKPVQKDEGDVAFKSEVPEQEDKTETDVKVDEFVKKMDVWSAYFSDDTDLRQLISTADDGVPFGGPELMQLMSIALLNASKQNDLASIEKISSDFGKMFVKLVEMTKQMTAEQTQKTAEDAVVDAVTEEAPAQDAAVEAAQEETPEAVVAEDVAVEQETVTAEDAPAVDAAEGVEKAVDAMAQKVFEALAALTESVSKSAEQLDTLAKKQAEIDAKVDSLHSAEQSRKGAVDDVATAVATPAKKQEPDILTKNLLGIR